MKKSLMPAQKATGKKLQEELSERYSADRAKIKANAGSGAGKQVAASVKAISNSAGKASSAANSTTARYEAAFGRKNRNRNKITSK